MPKEIKKAWAIVNNKLNKLDEHKTDAICIACDEIIKEKLLEEFPLVVW
jgi:fumarate hydratase class II